MLVPVCLARTFTTHEIECVVCAGRVTPLGLEMSNYPLDPPVSRMLIESVRRGVSPEVITIAAMLSVESVYYHPQRRDGKSTTVLRLQRAQR